MIEWGSNEAFISRAVRGYRRADGSVDPQAKIACEMTYRRGYCFSTAFSKLRGQAAKVESCARSNNKTRHHAPNRALISQICNGLEGVSLQSFLKVVRTLQILRDEPTSDDAAMELSKYLKANMPEPEIVPPNGIVPALWALNRPVYDRFWAAHVRLTREQLGHLVMTDPSLATNAKTHFFARLEEGYAQVGAKERGVYRLTDCAVDMVLSGLAAHVGKDALPARDELFSLDHQIGPRKGQVSKAFPRVFGNLVP